jgi:hypothetical protein
LAPDNDPASFNNSSSAKVGKSICSTDRQGDKGPSTNSGGEAHRLKELSWAPRARIERRGRRKEKKRKEKKRRDYKQ